MPIVFALIDDVHDFLWTGHEPLSTTLAETEEHSQITLRRFTRDVHKLKHRTVKGF